MRGASFPYMAATEPLPPALLARQLPQRRTVIDSNLDIDFFRLAPVLSRANFEGVMALLGVCALGLVVYSGLGALLGIMRLAELRFVMRRKPGPG